MIADIAVEKSFADMSRVFTTAKMQQVRFRCISIEGYVTRQVLPDHSLAAMVAARIAKTGPSQLVTLAMSQPVNPAPDCAPTKPISQIIVQSPSNLNLVLQH